MITIRGPILVRGQTPTSDRGGVSVTATTDTTGLTMRTAVAATTNSTFSSSLTSMVVTGTMGIAERDSVRKDVTTIDTAAMKSPTSMTTIKFTTRTIITRSVVEKTVGIVHSRGTGFLIEITRGQDTFQTPQRDSSENSRLMLRRLKMNRLQSPSPSLRNPLNSFSSLLQRQRSHILQNKNKKSPQCTKKLKRSKSKCL